MESRDFKGVWIPKEIYLNKDLSWTEKILLVEIDSLDNGEGCFASNEHLAKFLGKSKSQVANIISKLRLEGRIVNMGFNGRKRWLRVNPELRKTVRQSYGKAEHSNTVINTVKYMSDSQKSEPDLLTKNNTSLAVDMLGISSTANRQISAAEVDFALAASLAYQKIRKSYLPNSRKLAWKGKDYGQMVVLMREGLTLDQVETIFFNMFNENYHKETKWKYLTPEFVGRPTKVNLYGNNI